MQIDYGKVVLLMIAWLSLKEVVPTLANGLMTFLYEIIYMIIHKGEHSLLYWQRENDRLDLELNSRKRKNRAAKDDNRTIGFANDKIES